MPITVSSQRQLIGLIERSVDNLKKMGQNNYTATKVQSRIDVLEQQWQQFIDGNAILHDATAEEIKKTNAYFHADTFAAVENAYLSARDYMQECLATLKPIASTSSYSKGRESSSHTRSRAMPEISLPPFSGDYQDWRGFRDLFTSMVIENENLPAVEKLHYLKTHVSGEAARTLSKFSVTAAEFEPAWNALKKRYQNKRALLASYFEQLHDLKPASAPSVAYLKNLYDMLEEGQDGLPHLQVTKAEMWDFYLVHFISHRLDPETRKDWQFTLGDSTDPASCQELGKFITGRILAFESLSRADHLQSKPQVHRPAAGKNANRRLAAPARANASTTAKAFTCKYCESSHFIASCPTFQAQSAAHRREFVFTNGLCINCLGDHRIPDCHSAKRCRTCGERHHTLVHLNQDENPWPGTSSDTPNPPSAPQYSLSHNATVDRAENFERPTNLLPTARVLVENEFGELIEARALLDQASELSFIGEHLAQVLHLPRKCASIPVLGIFAQHAGSTRGVIALTIHSRIDPQVQFTVSAYVAPQATGRIPAVKVNSAPWVHLKGLPLADPTFAQPGRIDLVLGADIYCRLIHEVITRGGDDAPAAQLTALGWIISGPANEPLATRTSLPTPHSLAATPDHNLLDLVTQFWKQEEVLPSGRLHLSRDEEQCESFFTRTHSRTSSGRYVVRLPFKTSPQALGDSVTAASRVLQTTQRRLKSNITFGGMYINFMDEYESLGHMVRAPPSSAEHHRYYLPHHGILRKLSESTKLRVVFNGSMATTTGVSLNDCLHVGPKLQHELADIIMRWRQYAYVFLADIEKMYRQIIVHEQDRDYQRILWSAEGPPHDYQLCTVTYGLASAPYLALRVIQQLANDEGHHFPAAERVLRSEMYVDDVLSGDDTVPAAQEKAQQLIHLLTAGGFPLKKWIANHPDILQGIPPANFASSQTKALQDGGIARALGLSWSSASDAFIFKLNNLRPLNTLTKRTILSRIAQIFDPLGWITPITVTAKILMQQLWRTKCNWDDALPRDITSKWLAFEQSLSDVSLLSIPRWTGLSPTNLATEIHGFSDASQEAMGAVVYIRITDDSDTVRVTLLTAKSKVAPIAKQTVPRLELSAAVLLARLVTRVREVLGLHSVPVHLWVDSSVVLAWISGQPSQWKEYVANRVATIQELVPHGRWHHIAGVNNPADCASRGLSPSLLASHTLWWHAPSWLSQHSSAWPSGHPSLSPDVNLERRKSAIIAAVSIPDARQWDVIHRYSSLQRLLRITAWILRACSHFRKRSPSTSRSLTPSELSNAETFWIKNTQITYFSNDLSTLSTRSSLPSKHPLLRLAPFIDHAGILRVGGRLRNAQLDPDARHPILLPRASALSTMVIYEAHLRTLHGGVQLTLSHIRQKFWILGGRTPISSFIRRCVRCSRYRAATAQQLMGQLPPSRVTLTRPFYHSGVDYAGPFVLKSWSGRTCKTYKGFLVVFVCLGTSAVHLEVATDYSTQGFLAAYRRFTGRRGICHTLTSDCGSNLVGADAELKRLFRSATQHATDIATSLSNDGTEWRFNPPAAPHFGGKWEAAVKSVKHHLRRVIGDTKLTYEEFTTLLTQIEAVLNSRPLCPLSDDPADVQALTPAHFLIGGPLTTVPEPSLEAVPTSRLSRWQLVQQFHQRIWRRWSTEYLQRLQDITKWQEPSQAITVGSLVLISDERSPPSKWPLARVIATHPGADGLVRVVTVKTATSSYTRPITKLCLLPIDRKPINCQQPVS